MHPLFKFRGFGGCFHFIVFYIEIPVIKECRPCSDATSELDISAPGKEG